MILRQFKEAVWHRRGSDGDIAEAWHHGGEIVSAIKTVLEFGEVAGDMLVADSAVSAGDGALDVAEGGVDPLEGRVQGGLATGSSDDRLVDAADVADPSEAVQAVTDNGAGGLEIALRQGRDFGPAETLHAAQFQAGWLALWCGFDRRHDRRLAGRTAAPLAAVALPAEIGVVDLDPSRQALCGVPLHHRLHELVLDLPGGDLGDAKPAAQLNAGDAALALSEVVHDAKPSAQRHLMVADGAGGMTKLEDRRFEKGDWPISFEIPVAGEPAERWSRYLKWGCHKRGWSRASRGQLVRQENSGIITITGGGAPKLEIVWELR